MIKKTVGQVAVELQQKAPETRSPIEIEREAQQDYMKNLFDAVDRGFTEFNDSFFVEVTTKMEPLLHNVIRNYFATRQSCPTPNYDQACFRYNKDLEQIEYIWSVPSRETCHLMLENWKEVPKEEHDLLRFVVNFANGNLFKLCKKYNNEKDDTPELLKGN